MSVLDNLLYMRKVNRGIEIIKKNNEIITIDQTLNKILNDECLKDLTTLDGRINAIKQKYGWRKNIPIYLNEQVVLFPTHNSRDIDNIYINAVNIVGITKDCNQTKIIFSDKTSIVVYKAEHIIKKYYEKCLQIKKNKLIYL